MSVDFSVSRMIVELEIEEVRALALTHGWKVDTNPEELSIKVTMKAHNGDVYLVEMHCDDYKEKPPLIEFLEIDSGARGTPRAYPKSNDSFFHPSGPCICAPFSRKAYKAFSDSGPHSDWQSSDWMNSTANGIAWANFSRLGDILGLIQTRINRPNLYLGRMA